MAISLYFLVAIALIVGLFYKRQSKTNLPPGPPGHPFIGNYSQLRNRPLYKVVTAWGKRYGDFFSYKTGSKSIVVANSPAAFDELFVKKGTLYNSRPLNSAQTLRVTGDSRGVALPYGEPWKVSQTISTLSMAQG